MAFSPDSTRVVCGRADGTARVLTVTTGREVCSLIGDGTAVQGVAFAPDGGRVLLATDGGGVTLWHVRDKVKEADLRGHEGAVYSVAFSPDGRRALSGGEDHTLRLWDLAAGKELARFRPFKWPVTSVAFSQDGGFALCGDDKKWYWAKGTLKGADTVELSCDQVEYPSAVRYAWADNPTCNLASGAGLPAAPFRTDDFPGVTVGHHY